jgi:hypothetical protein
MSSLARTSERTIAFALTVFAEAGLHRSSRWCHGGVVVACTFYPEPHLTPPQARHNATHPSKPCSRAKNSSRMYAA